MRRTALLLAVTLLAAAVDAAAQVAQPYITTVTPGGGRRGSTVALVVEGFNLTGASEVLWSKPGVKSQITLNSEQMREKPKLAQGQTGALIIDKATRNRVTIEAAIAPDAPAGIYGFRLKTPLGTTNMGRVVIGALPETKEREAAEAAEGAQEIELPTTVIGELSKDGDADHFKFSAQAGEQVVFEVVAAALNSRLDSVLTLIDDKGAELASNNDFDGRRDSLLGYTFKQSGVYVIRISDLERQGQGGMYNYRLNVGALPYVTGVFPLGIRQGTTAEVTVTGFNLGSDRVKVTAPSEAGWGELAKLSLRPEPLNTPRLAVGRHPEVLEKAGGTSPAAPQPVALPVTVNGKIDAPGGRGDEDYYRFAARKGQRLLIEVGAQQHGSPLDSVIEVLEANGKPVPRATLRCLLETSVTLNDPDSARRGFRLLNWNGIQINDYLLVGNELLQVEALPKSPDEDTFFRGIGGQRIGYEDTTPETHAVNTPVYKVSIHPPGTPLPANGLPVVTLYYRNDDGGPLYGKDSRLNFTAPAEGEYIVRIRDVRGLGGERFAYRLSIREPAADYLLALDPENPNVPQGGRTPINVTASRIDGFDGEIEVNLLDLPAGFTATAGVIPAGQTSTVILLSASGDAQGVFPLRARGRAEAGGRPLIRDFKTEERLSMVSVAPPPELTVSTEPQRVVIEPGGQSSVTVKVERRRGFAGRVPIDIRGLPPGVIIKDVGLNGVLITEEEATQKFLLDAQPWVPRLEQPIFVVGRIETTSPQRSDFPAAPLLLSIQPKESAAQSQRR